MDDDQVTGPVDLGDLVGEERVGLVVVQPKGVRGGDGGGRVEPEKVVEEGPESCVSQLQFAGVYSKATYSSCRNPRSGLC